MTLVRAILDAAADERFLAVQCICNCTGHCGICLACDRSTKQLERSYFGFSKRVAAFEQQRKLAILIGVGDYPRSSGLRQLNYASNDVTALATQLSKDGYVVRTLINTDATRGAVRKALKDFAKNVDDTQGTVIVYFSGHGFAQDGVNYLAVFGTDADDLKGEGSPLTDLFDLLRQIPARRKVLFIDACRNDTYRIVTISY